MIMGERVNDRSCLWSKFKFWKVTEPQQTVWFLVFQTFHFSRASCYTSVGVGVFFFKEEEKSLWFASSGDDQLYLAVTLWITSFYNHFWYARSIGLTSSTWQGCEMLKFPGFCLCDVKQTFYSANGSWVVWVPVVWIPGISLWKGIVMKGLPLEPRTTSPNHQFFPLADIIGLITEPVPIIKEGWRRQE